jgi:hypothetical protein
MKSPANKNSVIARYIEGPTLLERALTGLKEADLDTAPSKGGWTIRQIVHHIVDGDDIWKTCIKHIFVLKSQEEKVFLPEKLFIIFQLLLTNEYFGSDLCFHSRRRTLFDGPHQTYIEDYSGFKIRILRNIQVALHLTYSKDVLSAQAESS